MEIRKHKEAKLNYLTDLISPEHTYSKVFLLGTSLFENVYIIDT